MTIKTFDKRTARLVSETALEALKAVAEKHGIVVRGKGGTYEGGTFTAKFEFAVIGEDGEAATREAEDFKVLCTIYGLEPSDLGKEFRLGTDTYKLCGLKANSQKYPLIARRKSDGSMRKLPESAIAQIIAAKTVAAQAH